MFKSLSRAVLAVAWLCLPAFATDKAQDPSPQQAGEFEATMSLEISSKGDVISAVPDPSVPETVGELLKKRVPLWKFGVPTFQGRPAQISALLKLRLQLAPTTGGGYGVRIINTYTPAPIAQEYGNVRFIGHPPSETLVYVVTVDTEGRNTGIELMLPKKRSRTARTMDYAARASIEHATPLKRTVDGRSVSCRILITMHYSFSGPAPDYTSETKAITDSLTDSCPGTRLLTEVAGTTL